jgi:hypothetical protein
MSPVAGKTLAESQVGTRSGAIVVGLWSRSRLHASCNGESRIEPGSLVELVGDRESLERAAAMFGAPYLRNSGPYLIAGFGEVGRKVHELLTDAGEEVRVIERQQVSGADFVERARSVGARGAPVRHSAGANCALNTDDATPSQQHLPRRRAGRSNHSRPITPLWRPLYRAGADCALSVGVSPAKCSPPASSAAVRTRDIAKSRACEPP